MVDPDDVAVDWINNKLYWVDSLWARIEVQNIDVSVGVDGERAELIKLTNHTIPRGIAVDPNSRLDHYCHQYIDFTDFYVCSLNV